MSFEIGSIKSNTLIADENDESKKIKFDLSDLASGTTRTMTFPDSNANLIGNETSDILTNKTISANNNTISDLNKSDVGLSNIENLKIKLDATATPTVNNDTSEGYSIGSRWIDTTNNKEYVCLDHTDGVAVWTETTQSGGGSVLTTKGDILTQDASSDTRLPIGTNGQILVADSAQTTGLKWTNNDAFYNITFGGNHNSNYYKADKDTSYVVASTFIFKGTDETPVSTCKVVVSTDSSDHVRIKLQDVTNATTIIEFPELVNSTGYNIQTSSSLNNLPTSEAIFEVQAKSAKDEKGYLYYFSLY